MSHELCGKRFFPNNTNVRQAPNDNIYRRIREDAYGVSGHDGWTMPTTPLRALVIIVVIHHSLLPQTAAADLTDAHEDIQRREEPEPHDERLK